MAAPAIGITGTDFSSSSFGGGGGGGGALRFVRTFPPILPLSDFGSELGSDLGVCGLFLEPFFEKDFADLGREYTVKLDEGDGDRGTRRCWEEWGDMGERRGGGGGGGEEGGGEHEVSELRLAEAREMRGGLG